MGLMPSPSRPDHHASQTAESPAAATAPSATDGVAPGPRRRRPSLSGSRVALDHKPLWAKAAIGANTYDFSSGRVLPTIYERTTALALQNDAANLGQGFPDGQGPQWMLEQAAAAITDADVGPGNQYAPGLGLLSLREAVAADHQDRHGVALDPEDEVIVTTGATEGITAAILAFAWPGSEVLTFEPHYDSYGACSALAGASLKGIPLRGPDFRPDIEALDDAITAKTSLILLNTPHNPTGTVFSPAELARIVEIAKKHGVTVMCDEVYEQLVLDGAAHAHRSILSVPGAKDVAVAVGSAGKSFSLTGWKVGWVAGGSELINHLRGIKQFLSYSSGPAYQWAVAEGIRDDRGYFAENAAQLSAGRDILREGLDAAGLRPNRADAGYFTVANISGVTDLSAEEFCTVLANEVKVAAIPVAALTIQHAAEPQDELQKLVRFAFCKNHATIEDALQRISSRLPAALDRHS